MKHVLITGGAGFIGSNFVHFLLSRVPELDVVNLDALTYAGSIDNLDGLELADRHQFIQGDIRQRAQLEDILRQHQIDTVVHLAAESHVDRSIHGAAPFVDTNIVGTYQLLEAVRSVWKDAGGGGNEERRFLHVSTDEVYGSLEPGEPAFTEDTPYAPNSPYAASKAASDHLVRAFGHTYGLPVMITNCSNNYGPRQFPEKLVPLTILNAAEGQPLPVYGDGQQIRDWLHVEDHCQALLTVLKKGLIGETYNIGGGNQPTNLEVVQTICRIIDEINPEAAHRPHEQLITFVGDRPGHDRRYAMDIGKIQSQLGWSPERNLMEGLQETIGWYFDHPDWVAAIRQRPTYQEWLTENYKLRGTRS